MVDSDILALKRETYNTHFQTWCKLLAEADGRIATNSKHINFSDIPWPLFTNIQTFPEFTQVAHEISLFLVRQNILIYDASKKCYRLFNQKELWSPILFKRIVYRRVNPADSKDVMKAYIRIYNILFKGGN